MNRLVFPQLATGSLSQFPLRKTRHKRTVINRAMDSGTVLLADPAGETTEWRLEYEDINDEEAAALERLFTDLEGSLGGFTFLDPSANLLAWSGELEAEVWQKDPLLTLSPGVVDPAGGGRAWRLTNAGGAGQGIGQTLQAPGEYTYCLSVYVRATAAGTVRLSIGAATIDHAVAEGWRRVTLTARGVSGTESLRFGIEAPAGATVEIYGPQVEAQGGASTYRESTRGGVYEDAHLRDDVFRVTRTGFNRNSCTVNIVHAIHI